MCGDLVESGTVNFRFITAVLGRGVCPKRVLGGSYTWWFGFACFQQGILQGSLSFLFGRIKPGSGQLERVFSMNYHDPSFSKWFVTFAVSFWLCLPFPKAGHGLLGVLFGWFASKLEGPGFPGSIIHRGHPFLQKGHLWIIP